MKLENSKAAEGTREPCRTGVDSHTCSEQHLELFKWNVSCMQIKTGHLVEKDKVAALSSECLKVRLKLRLRTPYRK